MPLPLAVTRKIYNFRFNDFKYFLIIYHLTRLFVS